MATVRIHDIDSQGILACTLSRLLDLLVPRSLEAAWTVSAVPTANPHFDWFDVIGDGSAELDVLAQSHTRLPGHDLAALADRTRQIIWGSFTASLSKSKDDPWLTIRAIDSTFYEVTTPDDTVLVAILQSFKHVRSADAPWLPQSAP